MNLINGIKGSCAIFANGNFKPLFVNKSHIQVVAESIKGASLGIKNIQAFIPVPALLIIFALFISLIAVIIYLKKSKSTLEIKYNRLRQKAKEKIASINEQKIELNNKIQDLMNPLLIEDNKEPDQVIYHSQYQKDETILQIKKDNDRLAKIVHMKQDTINNLQATENNLLDRIDELEKLLAQKNAAETSVTVNNTDETEDKMTIDSPK